MLKVKNKKGPSKLCRKIGKRRALNLMRASIKVSNSKSDLLGNLCDLKLYKSSESGRSFKITCARYSECSQDLFSWMMNLLQENMADLYASCDWGWNITEKRKEMSDKKARFIVAYSNSSPVAFTHFRFDLDNDTSVVYCYELQVEKSAQKQGLAKHIIKVLQSLCQLQNMSKVVLTVFNHNENAFNFFTSQGFNLDVTSPQNFGVEACYSILSKANNEFNCIPS